MFDWLIPLIQLGVIGLGIGVFIAFVTHPIEMIRLTGRGIKWIRKVVKELLEEVR